MNILERIDEAKTKMVIRKGKLVKKLFCPPGFKASGGKCVKMSNKEMLKRSRATKKAQKKLQANKSKLIKMNKARMKSLKKRGAKIPDVSGGDVNPMKTFEDTNILERIDKLILETSFSAAVVGSGQTRVHGDYTQDITIMQQKEPFNKEPVRFSKLLGAFVPREKQPDVNLKDGEHEYIK